MMLVQFLMPKQRSLKEKSLRKRVYIIYASFGFQSTLTTFKIPHANTH